MAQGNGFHLGQTKLISLVHFVYFTSPVQTGKYIKGGASTGRWAVIDGGVGRSLWPNRQHPWRRPGWPGSHSQWERKLAWENQEELPLTIRS